MFVNLYVDFRLEHPDIYEVRYGKLRVVKKIEHPTVPACHLPEPDEVPDNYLTKNILQSI